MAIITEYIKVERPSGNGKWVITNRVGTKRIELYAHDLSETLLRMMENREVEYFMADYDTDTFMYTLIRYAREQEW